MRWAQEDERRALTKPFRLANSSASLSAAFVSQGCLMMFLSAELLSSDKAACLLALKTMFCPRMIGEESNT
ncbi:hypothetical protein Bpfe_028215 [Biomphalaria pfeifferi]|uniref:Uncharacterized protein n=1 Tax=Biomphalaria pfeifferi TaxID=112525 RepID=A0AAD8AV06_BIOPF|nr:hypothetical protein Bpfe_028215 [Biomphalaria pfeifferi]